MAGPAKVGVSLALLAVVLSSVHGIPSEQN